MSGVYRIAQDAAFMKGCYFICECQDLFLTLRTHVRNYYECKAHLFHFSLNIWPCLTAFLIGCVSIC